MRLERFDKIIDYLKISGKASFGELARINSVSVDTIRRDLQDLETKGIYAEFCDGNGKRPCRNYPQERQGSNDVPW